MTKSFLGTPYPKCGWKALQPAVANPAALLRQNRKSCRASLTSFFSFAEKSWKLRFPSFFGSAEKASRFMKILRIFKLLRTPSLKIARSFQANLEKYRIAVLGNFFIYFKSHILLMASNQTARSIVKMFFFGILLIIIIGSIVMLKNSFASASPNPKAAESVKALYELANPGTTFEITAVTESSGVYKVLLKSVGTSGTNYNAVYITKDGKLLSPSVILVENSTAQLSKTKGFVDCLNEKNVRIFGVLNDSFSPQGAATTSLQLQALGIYSGKIYISCDGANLQSCITLGISEVPSVLYDNTLYPGARDIPWFEQLSGCKF